MMTGLKRCRFFGHAYVPPEHLRNTALTAELTVEPRARFIA